MSFSLPIVPTYLFSTLTGCGDKEKDDPVDSNSPDDTETPDFIDADGDDFPLVNPEDSSLNDCDDNDPNTYPGATEVCDGVDNDCDGPVDEGFSHSEYYIDADSDGYGDSQNAMSACAAPENFVDNADDCNDEDSSVYPGAPICDNDGVIEDCGMSDEEALQECRLQTSGIGESIDAVDDVHQITGVKEYDYLSHSLAVADFNQDGKDDFCFGAPDDFFGRVDCYISTPKSDLADISGTYTLTQIVGDVNADLTGLSAAREPLDFNKDGTPDLAIAVPGYDGSNPNGGAVVIFDGNQLVTGGVLSLSDADIRMLGDRHTEYGSPVAVADGHKIIASEYVSNNTVYVCDIANRSGPIIVSEDDDCYKITSDDDTDGVGSSVAAGDLNKDGKDEIMIGAYQAGGFTNICYLGPDGYACDGIVIGIDGSKITGDDVVIPTYISDGGASLIGMFAIAGRGPGQFPGSPLYTLGNTMWAQSDVTGDGYNDLVACTPSDEFDTQTDFAGACYVIAGGSSLPTSRQTQDADIIIAGNTTEPDYHDFSVGESVFACDVDGDGVDDVMTSSTQSAQLLGASRFFLGSSSIFYADGLTGTVKASDADAIYWGSLTLDLQSGVGVGGGDFNADGLCDFVSLNPFNDKDTGRSFIIEATSY